MISNYRNAVVKKDNNSSRIWRTSNYGLQSGTDERLGKLCKICSSNKDPKTCKSLGRKVKPFNQKLWSNSVLEIATAVVTQKFASNKFLWDILNKTENRVIAEMTQRDKNWGTGINKSHVNANNPPHWKGTNILGYALMIARKRLREDI